MGWLTDPLFGKRKAMDVNKMNSFMAPYDSMVDEQEKFARQAMDPNSARNRQMRDQVRTQSFDLAGAQNQGLMGAAAMNNMSPGQLAMQQSANSSNMSNQFSNQMTGLMSSQYNSGMNMFNQSMQSRKGIGERGANMYMQKINASNEARAGNISMVKELAIAGLGAAGGAMSGGMMG